MPQDTTLHNSPSYEIWNREVAEYSYNLESAGRPVYLQIDSETLREIGQRLGVEPSEAEHSFIQAVRSRLRLQHGDLFDNFLHQIPKWQLLDIKANPAAPPPFLGLLGICVLAASRMTNDPTRGVSSANYYVWLNDLLGLKRQGTPHSFERISELWSQLDEGCA